MSSLMYKLIFTAALAVASSITQAAVVQVNFDYAPNSAAETVKLSGQFTYDATNIGADNLVNASDLQSFSYTLSNNALSLTTDLLAVNNSRGGRFVFTYDPAIQAFLLGVGQQLWSPARSDGVSDLGIGSAGRGGGSAVFMRLNAVVNGVLSGRIFVANDNAIAAANKFSYTVTAVPEPESYGMLLLGLGLVTAVVRRKQSI